MTAAAGRVAELHELQGEAMVVVHVPLHAAVERVLAVLHKGGSCSITSSSAVRVVVTGIWRSAPGRVKYEVVVTPVGSTSATLAQFYSRNRKALLFMLATQLTPSLNNETVAPGRPAFRSVAAGKDVRVRFADYDGGLPGHPRPERRGKLVLPSSEPELTFNWRRPKGMPRSTTDLLARYSIQAEPRTGGSSHLVIRLRRDPNVVAHLDLPAVSAERFDQMLQTKIRRHAERGRSVMHVANYDGHLPAHARPEASGTLTLVRARWTLRFPGTDRLLDGLVTADSPTVVRTGPTSSRMVIAVPQAPNGVSTVDLPDLEAEALAAELAARRDLGTAGFEPLAAKGTRELLAATGRPQAAAPGGAPATKNPAGAVAGVFAALLTTAAIIWVAIALSTPSKNIGAGPSNGSSGGGSPSGPVQAGVVDNCRSGYGYLDVANNRCYAGSGPGANNAAGGGVNANCPSGYPYFNAATGKCWTSVPGSGSSGGASGGGPAGGQQGGVRGEVSEGSTNPGTVCSYSTQPDGSNGTVYTAHTVSGGPCYLHVTEFAEQRPDCFATQNGSGQFGPPPDIWNIVAWDQGTAPYSYTDSYGTHTADLGYFIATFNGGGLAIVCDPQSMGLYIQKGRFSHDWGNP